MRAPLAFLLGKLDFQKEFRNLQAKPEGTDMRITAEPKTDNLPYSAVEFVVTPDQHIKVVKVTGFDHSILDSASMRKGRPRHGRQAVPVFGS